MALILYGGNAAEVLVQENGSGDLSLASFTELNGRLFSARTGGLVVQPLNAGGSPITVTTDALAGVPEFWVDDEVATQVWFNRGSGFARQRLYAQGPISQLEADDRYILLDSLGQPDGPAQLDGSGKLTLAQLPVVATPIAGQLPRYNGDANLVTADPVTDLAAANRRWTLDQIVALSGIQPAKALAADFVNATTATDPIPGLTQPVTDGDEWHLYGLLIYRASAAAGINVQLDVPGGSGVTGYSEGYRLDATPATEASLVRQISAGGALPTRLAFAHGGIGVGAVHSPIRFEARVVAGANGNIRVDAGQNTADATPITVYAGSYVLFAHVAPPESP